MKKEEDVRQMKMFRLEINIFIYVCHAVYETSIKINAVEAPEV